MTLFLSLLPLADEGYRAKVRLTCWQAGPQEPRVRVLTSWTGTLLAASVEEEQRLPGTNTPGKLAFPPSSFFKFITSHLPSTHQCESWTHSWSVCPVSPKPVLLGSLFSGCLSTGSVLLSPLPSYPFLPCLGEGPSISKEHAVSGESGPVSVPLVSEE